MGFDLVDSQNQRHPYGSDESQDLNDMLKSIRALPVEPFVVLPGLPKNLFPPSEVTFMFSGIRSRSVHTFILSYFSPLQ